MQHPRKKNHMLPIAAGIMVSGFFTAEVATVLFGLTYLVPAGLLQKSAFVLIGMMVIVLFLWIYRRVYKVELELLSPDGDNATGV